MVDQPQLKAVRPRLRFVTLRTVAAMMLRQMSASYGRRPGGYIWAILEPAGGIIVMVAVFSSGFRTPPLGTNFAVFYASGFLPYIMFQKLSGTVGNSVRRSKALLTFPRITLVDAILATALLEIVTQLLISYLIFSAILGVFDTRTSLDLPVLISTYTMAIALGLGIGILNCYLFMAISLWRSIWGIVTRPLVLVSGVIFLHERIPEPYRGWLEWNPLVHVVGQARKAFYVSYRAEYVDQVFVYMVAGVCAVVGLVFLKRYYRDLLEK